VRWILNNVPTVPLGVVIIAASVVFSLVILAWVRRRGAHAFMDNDALGVLFTVIGIVYGIMLAFAIVDLWTSFGAARETISAEAGALAQVTVDIRPLAQADRHAVEASIATYVRTVVTEERMAMRNGRESEAAHTALDAVAFTLERAQPVTPAQQAWYSEAVTKLNEVVTARRTRLEAAEGGMPLPFELLLFLGAVIPIGFMTLVNVPHRAITTAMVVATAALVGYGLFLVVILNFPFSGTVTVSFEPFRAGVLGRL